MSAPETPKLRFAFYGRLSTTDKQDPALSFPSQLSACKRKAAELGGVITCEFTDQQSGATIDRPGWMALAQEATDRDKRRFDAVVIYSTSRLARDIHVATLFARDLEKQQVPIHYATGGGDPSTPEGEMFIGMQHLWDQFERAKLSRETKRGMREGAGQGYRMGGRAPYGYMRETEDMPEGHLGDTSKKRVRLVPHPEEAEVVTEIFDMHAHLGMSTPQIADELNRRKIPSPKAVSRARNPKHVWSASTIRTMLKNEIYTGRMIWDRLDFATIRKNGGGTPKLRAREEWQITENAHLPLVTDETFRLSQEKFTTAPPRKPASKKGKYLFAGMVFCSCGHQPLSMHGKSRKGHLYYACNYGDYGETAAIEAHNGQKWIYLREDVIEPFVMRFFAQRIFGPMRIEKLAKQLQAERSKKQTGQKALATRLRAPLDVFIVRKLGVPGHEELAMGAIASGGALVINHEVIQHIQHAVHTSRLDHLQPLLQRILALIGVVWVCHALPNPPGHQSKTLR